MITVLRFVLICISCLTFSTCTHKNNVETIYKSLKEGQAKVVITINDEPFYSDSSIFTGSTIITDKSFKINLFDQFESNIIIGFNGDNWYVNKPIERQIFADNEVQASVMIGKVTDKINRYGAGYLMTEGKLSIQAISDEKLIIHFEGKVGKYESMREPKKWSVAVGDIIYKKPPIVLTILKKSDIYF